MKGQAALEFLMTYGWAILAIVVLIGALAFFGVLSPQNTVPSACVLEPPFMCKQHFIKTDGVRVEIVNNGGNDIIDTTIHFSTSDGKNCVASAEVMPYGSVAPSASFSAGVIHWDSGHCASLNKLDRFVGNFTIEYRYAGDSLSHIATGFLQGVVEN